MSSCSSRALRAIGLKGCKGHQVRIVSGVNRKQYDSQLQAVAMCLLTKIILLPLLPLRTSFNLPAGL